MLVCSLATVLSGIERSVHLWPAARAHASHVFPRSRSPSHQARSCCHKCLPQAAMLEPIWLWRIGNICSIWFVSDPTAGMRQTGSLLSGTCWILCGSYTKHVTKHKCCFSDPIGSCPDPVDFEGSLLQNRYFLGSPCFNIYY